MPTPLYLALREVNGSKLVVLTDTTKYELPAPGWMPGVPLPTRDGYADVTEAIPIKIVGATPTAAQTNLHALAAILDQAHCWSLGDLVNPIVMDYTAPGSSPTKVLSSLITGWNPDGFLPEDYNHRIATTNSTTATVGIQRAGAWLHESGIQTADAVLADNPVIQTVTLPSSADHASPATITFSFAMNINQLISYRNLGAGYAIAVNGPASDLYLHDWYPVADGTVGPSPAFTRIAEGNGAVGGAVLRFTPASTAKQAPNAYIDFTTVRRGSHAVLFTARNNSATTTFQVSFRASRNQVTVGETIPVTVEPFSGSAKPLVISAGSFGGDDTEFDRLDLFVQASAASGSLDLDTTLLVACTRFHSIVGYATIMPYNGQIRSLSLRHEPFTRRKGRMLAASQRWNGTDFIDIQVPATYVGRARPMSVGSQVSGILYCTDDTYWRQRIMYDSASNTISPVGLAVSRFPTFIIPE